MGTPTLARYFNCFIDSDGVVADFDKALKKSGLHQDVFKHQPGTYLWLDVVPGATEALAKLKEWDDQDLIRVFVATKTPSNAPYAYTEKVLWYREKFPWLEDRVILTHDKSVLGTENDFLVDDRPHKGNADKFRGTFIEFDVNDPEQMWADVIELIQSSLHSNDAS